MNSLDSPQNHQQSASNVNNSCLLAPEVQPFEPQAEDILTDEDLLDLFRIVKQVIRKNPDSEKLAKLLFCMSYALGDHIKFSKPCHEDRIVFRDNYSGVHSVRLSSTSSCCSNSNTSITFHQQGHRASSTFSHPLSADLPRPTEKDAVQKWIDSSSVTSHTSPSPISPLTRLPSVSYLTNSSNQLSEHQNNSTITLSEISNENRSTDLYSLRPYTNFHPLYAATSSSPTLTASASVVNSSNTAAIASPLTNGNNSIPSPASSSTTQNVQQHMVEVAALANIENPDHAIPNTTTNPNTSIAMNNSIQKITNPANSNVEVVMEPQQRGFYYQDGRITREPVLLQRYAEQGILTQASLMRKRKRHSVDANASYEVSAASVPTKKPKIPHRHGEFEQRRDDIISRMRTITMADLEQKAQRLSNQFTLAIDQSVTDAEGALSATVANGQLSREQLVDLLEPALRILTNHSNMKPHLDNGMNQNGIYYNSDYFRLYLAFEQFQRTFAILFPNEVIKISDTSATKAAEGEENGLVEPTGSSGTTAAERDKDRERNANMKAYRVWIEPLLTETNWAAFRRNIVVGERMMQLTKSVGQGILLMTKELSGSKLHLTFTNSEWDEFINGLNSGRWDQTIEWESDHKKQLLQQQRDDNISLLVSELQLKFATHYWFYPDGLLVSSKERRLVIHASSVAANSNSNILMHRNSMDPSLLHRNQQSNLDQY